MANRRAAKRYSIVCICQIFNEIQKGNLRRFVRYIKPLVDHLVIWDDASTDGSYEYAAQHTPHVIRSKRTDFKNEMRIKQTLLNYALKLKPHFVMYLDADEVFSANAKYRLQELCDYCERKKIDGLSFHKLNLWRSRSWRRIDNLYDDGWFVHLWRVKPGMTYGRIRRGLHLPPYPITVRRIKRVNDVQVIHYGFSSERLIAYKYLTYRAYGQRGYDLSRLIDEGGLELRKVPKGTFPRGLYINDPRPKQLSLQEASAYIEKYRKEVVLPRFSTATIVLDAISSFVPIMRKEARQRLPVRVREYLHVGRHLVKRR